MPRQDGVLERMNKMLMEKAMGMINSVRLGCEFWAEAFNTICYLVN
jgi:hypothetical protein